MPIPQADSGLCARVKHRGLGITAAADMREMPTTEIRDTAGDILPIFGPAGLNVRLHNWLPFCVDPIL